MIKPWRLTNNPTISLLIYALNPYPILPTWLYFSPFIFLFFFCFCFCCFWFGWFGSLNLSKVLKVFNVTWESIQLITGALFISQQLILIVYMDGEFPWQNWMSVRLHMHTIILKKEKIVNGIRETLHCIHRQSLRKKQTASSLLVVTINWNVNVYSPFSSIWSKGHGAAFAFFIALFLFVVCLV